MYAANIQGEIIPGASVRLTQYKLNLAPQIKIDELLARLMRVTPEPVKFTITESAIDTIKTKLDNPQQPLIFITQKDSNKTSKEDEILPSSSNSLSGSIILDDTADTIKFTEMLLYHIRQDDFTAGEISGTEEYILTIVEKLGWKKTLQWLQKVAWNKFYDSHVVTGILHSLSHYDYNDIALGGGMWIAMGLLRHEDIYVRDLAVRAFENWNSKKAIPALKSLNCGESWQQDYVDSVILALESEGVE